MIEVYIQYHVWSTEKQEYANTQNFIFHDITHGMHSISIIENVGAFNDHFLRQLLIQL